MWYTDVKNHNHKNASITVTLYPKSRVSRVASRAGLGWGAFTEASMFMPPRRAHTEGEYSLEKWLPLLEMMDYGSVGSSTGILDMGDGCGGRPCARRLSAAGNDTLYNTAPHKCMATAGGMENSPIKSCLYIVLVQWSLQRYTWGWIPNAKYCVPKSRSSMLGQKGGGGDCTYHNIITHTNATSAATITTIASRINTGCHPHHVCHHYHRLHISYSPSPTTKIIKPRASRSTRNVACKLIKGKSVRGSEGKQSRKQKYNNTKIRKLNPAGDKKWDHNKR